MKKKIILLGASGSIGKSAVDVIKKNRDSFEPVLFQAHRDVEALLALKKEFPDASLALTGEEKISEGKISFCGKEGLFRAIAESGADMAINGIAGAAGLPPSLACIEAGINLALANKETIVMAGPLVLENARKKNVKIIPVDSEHSAIFRLLEAFVPSEAPALDEIILTASGGPFRTMPRERLASVRKEDALAHPTWNMGQKITIDSATLANKGLEVIEAHFLFNVPPEKIRVTVHPQSIVHSMIRLKNGAVYAQLSKPDMRLPIHDALFWPESGAVPVARPEMPSPFGFLDFENLHLDFEKPDTEKFPMLNLAYEALKCGPYGPVLYNAANEAAVGAFLKNEIPFLEIPRIVGYVLESGLRLAEASGPDSIFEADKKGREKAGGFIKSSKFMER